MQIFIGADHRGFEWKEKLKELLAGGVPGLENIEVRDLGSFEYNQDDDFNDAAIAVSEAVRGNTDARGILICGSGDGMCIQANRFKGIRASRCSSASEAQIAREHDDINVLCLSADRLDANLLEQLVVTFLQTGFDEQNSNRMRRIGRLDEENYA